MEGTGSHMRLPELIVKLIALSDGPLSSCYRLPRGKSIRLIAQCAQDKHFRQQGVTGSVGRMFADAGFQLVRDTAAFSSVRKGLMQA